MAKNRILIVEDDPSLRVLIEALEVDAFIDSAVGMCHPVQDCGVPVFTHRQVTLPAYVLLSPRAPQHADATSTRLRVAAAIGMMLLVAFGAGAAM